ncbi:MAG: peptidase Do [Anaerosolibacter sp.]|jgi:S1-C subfamily serine protease|uniref:S1 family peptidase n=1 Tax=Anaerosolibacter sp. TaxID=1872527 RepID=UPI00263231C6|nr:serine protease [Anaerosolibacter sp.]MDF2545905.1 peptidase Do [Anaerosolibacter sp.]
MKTRQKTIFLKIMVFFMLIISFFLPSIKSFINQTMNREFMERVVKYALPANIKIVQLKYRNEGNSSSTSVSAGASGVIIRKESNKYYALTAKHVVTENDDIDKTQIVVMGYDDLDFKDYLSRGGAFQGIVNYYQQFPEAVIEYSNDKYDLALISFIADEVYTVLPVADEIPEYGDIVASMSNPYRKRNIVTAGKISSRKPRPFGDEAGKMQYPMIKHTAILSEGSSGSALLNENLEVVGINLGGNENVFRNFISGMAMPSDRIRAFLEEWEN